MDTGFQITAAFLIVAYLIGSISFAIIVSKAFHLADPRSFGSKNPGATNVYRTGKRLAAFITLTGDAGKGWFIVYLAKTIGVQYGLPVGQVGLVALAVFVGHLYPIYFKFRGGKGVATALGILLAFNIWLGLAVAATWGVALAIWRISSLSALIAASLAPIYTWAIVGSPRHIAVVSVISMLLIWRHQRNIRNLIDGKELSAKKRSSGG